MILQLLGASGAGKSTLAKALTQKTGLPHLQSDHYLWPDEKFDIPRPVEERRAAAAPVCLGLRCAAGAGRRI